MEGFHNGKTWEVYLPDGAYEIDPTWAQGWLDRPMPENERTHVEIVQ
jgi:hypothetical protein